MLPTQRRRALSLCRRSTVIFAVAVGLTDFEDLGFGVRALQAAEQRGDRHNGATTRCHICTSSPSQLATDNRLRPLNIPLSLSAYVVGDSGRATLTAAEAVP